MNIKYVFPLLLIIFSFLRFDAFFDGSSRFIPFKSFLFFLFFFIVLLTKKYYKLRRNEYFLILFVFVCSAFFSGNFFGPEYFKNYYSLIYFCCYLIIFSVVIKQTDKEILYKIESFFLKLFVIIFFIESYIRFFYPQLGINDHSLYNLSEEFNISEFYYFKYGSIMFYDSNYTGLAVLSIFTYTLISKKNLYTIIYFLILLSTFSRSAIICAILVYIFNLIPDLNRITLNQIIKGLIFLLIIITFFIFGVSDFITNDSSYLTKLNIFENFKNKFLNYSLIEFLFGFGYTDGGFMYSPNPKAYAHAFFPLILGQIGFLGSLIYFFTLLYVFLNGVRLKYYLWIISFLITGFSLSDPFEPYFFIPMILFIGINRKCLAYI